MPSRRKKAKAVLPTDFDLAGITKANPYIQRLIEDSHVRENVRSAIDSTKNVYERLSNGKSPAKALLEDKKLQHEIAKAVEAIRDLTTALTEPPRRQARKSRRFGRKVVIVGLGAGLALVGSEQLRSKVLDTLFGAEEEFEYTPPAPTTPPAETPVGAA